MRAGVINKVVKISVLLGVITGVGAYFIGLANHSDGSHSFYAAMGVASIVTAVGLLSGIFFSWIDADI